MSPFIKKIELERRKYSSEITLYNRHKNNKVLLASGNKVKVRQYIASLARNLSSVNEASYEANRSMLIKAYNGGDYITALKRVTADYNFIIKQLRLQHKKQLKTQKNV